MNCEYNFEELELINKISVGPFNMEEWLNYNNENKITDDKRLNSKINILTNYPRFLDISLNISSFRKDEETGVKKICFEIRHNIVEKKNFSKELDIRQEIINSDKSGNITHNSQDGSCWRNENRFKLYNISESTLNKVRQNDISTRNKSTDKGRNKKEQHLNTLVIRNVPQNKKINELENILQKIFVKFGDIYRIKILNNRNNTNGLVFIDFKDKISVENALNQEEHLFIDSNKLTLERKHSTKERRTG